MYGVECLVKRFRMGKKSKKSTKKKKGKIAIAAAASSGARQQSADNEGNVQVRQRLNSELSSSLQFCLNMKSHPKGCHPQRGPDGN